MCTVFRKYDFILSMVFLQKVCLFREKKEGKRMNGKWDGFKGCLIVYLSGRKENKCI